MAGGGWWVVRNDGGGGCCPRLKEKGYGAGGAERGKEGTD